MSEIVSDRIVLIFNFPIWISSQFFTLGQNTIMFCGVVVIKLWNLCAPHLSCIKVISIRRQKNLSRISIKINIDYALFSIWILSGTTGIHQNPRSMQLSKRKELNFNIQQRISASHCCWVPKMPKINIKILFLVRWCFFSPVVVEAFPFGPIYSDVHCTHIHQP